MKCKITGTLFKGQNSVVSVVGLLSYHRYKVTLRCNLSSTTQQQYILNIQTPNNGGITTRTDSVPSVSTNSTSFVSTASNKNFLPFYITNAGDLVDNTYSTTNTLGFDVNLDGTQSNVTDDKYPVSIEIEAVD
ncbi:hypothetical protein CPT_Muenster_221 [Klebsiella phage Muenster]|nr:hypothetical protein CPT_Muenster_221 [Klebsiella phage Muenster]